MKNVEHEPKCCLRILFFSALALNLLKGIFERVLSFLVILCEILNSSLKKNEERSKIPFNKFRASAGEEQHFFSSYQMRTMLFLSFAFLSINIYTEIQPAQNAQFEQVVHEGQHLIDTLFEHAHTAVEARQDLMDEEWLGQQKEIHELQNVLSDARILSFDAHTENPIPNLLSAYVMQKVDEEVLRIFDVYGISIKQVEDFYEFSHTMCKLSGGIHCGRMIRTIQSDNFDRMLRLKVQKAAREQLRKETAQQLRDAFLFGEYR